MPKREDIRIRDPFILVEKDKYYMYGTTDLQMGSLAANHTFSVYVSSDLENFEGPFVVFDGKKEGFWADRDYWAAEVWKYEGKFYLFGSFKANSHRRATQILIADTPLGPFRPFSEKPHTPEEWECLDGTLYVENGQPYMVFCHEWLQCENGEMCAIRLTPDLRGIIGKPVVLFRAGDNPFVDGWASGEMKCCKITDGPFLYKRGNKLKMIWSSGACGKYAVLEAEADSLFGAWEHKKPRFDFDGGHAMIFTDLQGGTRLALHSPNHVNLERAMFLPIEI